jgi:glycerol-3-phosphate acyltransferase PlsX
MGATYARQILGIPKPRVGLLSNGEEEGKGTALVSEAHGLIKELGLHFTGNVEGRDLFNGRADVIVCDGFVGNVLLKGAEGVAEMIFTLLKEELQKDLRSRIGGLLCRPAFRSFYKRLDYAEQGSAPLLGVRGVFMIGHGKSPGRAVANAVRTAARVVREGVNEAIQEALARAPGRAAVGLNEG